MWCNGATQKYRVFCHREMHFDKIDKCHNWLNSKCNSTKFRLLLFAGWYFGQVLEWQCSQVRSDEMREKETDRDGEQRGKYKYFVILWFWWWIFNEQFCGYILQMAKEFIFIYYASIAVEKATTTKTRIPIFRLLKSFAYGGQVSIYGAS